MKPLRPCLVAMCFLVLASTAAAQFPKHTLTSIFPAGGQAGTNVAVEIGGTELDTPLGLAFDHPGLRAFRVKGPKFVVAIATGVPLGHHDVRVVGPLGASNPRAFLVGDQLESREIEPNNTPETSQPIALGDVIHGRLDAVPDVDTFAIAGKRGTLLIAELASASIDSKLDGVLRLISPSGRDLIGPSDLPGPEPTLVYRFPEEGRYLLQVHDLVYAGSPDHGYRLTLRNGCHLAAIEPLPGTAKTHAVLGHDVMGKRPDPARYPPSWDSGLTTLRTIDSPPISSGLALTPGQWFVWPDPNFASNSAFLAEATEPVVAETEPNDSPTRPQTLVPPCEVISSFRGPRDVDRFRFHAGAGKRWVIEVIADRMGIPVDPEFVIRKRNTDGTSQDIAIGDDQADPFDGKRFPVGTLDPRVTFNAPADDDYEIVVRDSNGSGRTDAPLAYRLKIRPERPDFDLILVPNDGTNPEATTVRAGGRTSAYVMARRIDGLTSPIRVIASELPAGVTYDPVVIGTNQAMAPIVFSADVGAASGLGKVRLIGRSLSGDRKDVLDFTAGQTLVPDREHVAFSGALVWPMAANGNDQPAIAQARTTTEFALAVRDGAPFRLTVKPEGAVLGAGESVEWTVEVERRAGFTEAVQVTASDLPPNLPAPAAVTIAKDKTSATIETTIPKEVPPGLYTMLFRGTGPFPFRKDPNAKDPANITVNEPANAVILTIRR